MKHIKAFLKSSGFKRFIWLTVEGFLTALITYFSGISWIYAPIIMGVLANFIKFINENYLQKSKLLARVL